MAGSSPMSDEHLAEMEVHPENFIKCPAGNFHHFKGDDHPPIICTCTANKVFQAPSCRYPGEPVTWSHFANITLQPENETVPQDHVPVSKPDNQH